jgi:hypothetical protein
MSSSMKAGPFGLLPRGLVLLEPAGIEEWEEHAKTLFFMQKNIQWWMGDMVVYGERQFGDDFWQIPPEGTSEGMLKRSMVASLNTPFENRTDLSWTHHQSALRIKDMTLRSALMRKAERDQLDTQQFNDLIRESVNGK